MENADIKYYPEPNVDCMIMYEKTIRFGAYGNQQRKEIVVKRGFYSAIFDNFSIPPEYRMFCGVLLPYGFGGDHITIDKIMSWEYV